MDHVILIGESLLAFLKEYIDVVEYHIEQLPAIHQVHSELYCVCGYACLEAFNSVIGYADAHVTQHLHDTQACARDFEEQAKDKG